MNATVGDLDGNASRIRTGIEAAKRVGAELVLFPELALCGYPPEDLLLREHFLSDTGAKLGELGQAAVGIVAIVGFPERSGGKLYNSAAVLAGGTVSTVYRKVHLPNYGVFDEQRYFTSGGGVKTVDLGALLDAGEARCEDRPDEAGATEMASLDAAATPREDRPGEAGATEMGVAVAGEDGVLLGVTVCEDLWVDGPPACGQASAGACLIANISASPYHAGKGLERERLFGKRARETGAHIAFCAMVGGQDELVFDGHSFVLDQTGETIARGAQFEEDLVVCDLPFAVGQEPAVSRSAAHCSTPPSSVSSSAADDAVARLDAPIAVIEQEVYEALLLGLGDYVRKNAFGGVVLGLSGGIDSALVACLAVDALGPERVNVAIMPSRYSSSATQEDARALARALGVRTHELEIEPAMDAYMQTLRADFQGLEADLTEENLQARIRGNLLMALSNKFGWLVLTTGNKSEMSVGYTTLYGDLAGGFAVIKDVPKTLVYRLARWRNTPAATAHERASAVRVACERVGSGGTSSAQMGSGGIGSGRVASPIPQSIIERAPSAELRHDQTDQDSLPPYDVLDRILHGYIELDRSREQLVGEGLAQEDVERIATLVDRAEYKRRQAPPGIKITERAFGRDRRMPITNAYRG